MHSNILTPRERICILAWQEYKTMKKAGKALGISPRTVQSHCYSAMKKLAIYKKHCLFKHLQQCI